MCKSEDRSGAWEILQKSFEVAKEPSLAGIAEKVFAGERISCEEALLLYRKASLPFVGMLAAEVKKRYNGNKAFFNRNIHIEPTNICVCGCLFCSYSRKKGEEGSWEYSIDDIMDQIKSHLSGGITEVHIVGGVHPVWTMEYYLKMISTIKKEFPHLHIKAFTAVEIDAMTSRAGISYEEGLRRLKEAGLDSLPGGGAEIFDPRVRKQLCPSKTTGEKWLAIHRAAHRTGLPSNATMLYGHIESYEQRVDHLNQIRSLQDETHGFNAFIPLKFRHENNAFSYLKEIPLLEDLKNYALCRIFLDNIPHLKAYWPMIGKRAAQLALVFGADDMDGTIEDTTKIYTLAGVEESPSMSTDEMIMLIKEMGLQPVERDSLYREIKIY